MALIRCSSVNWNGLTFRGPLARQALAGPAGLSQAFGANQECLAPWRVFYVRAGGGVRTWCTLRSSMGDLGEQSFEEFWKGDAYRRLRSAFAEQRGRPPAGLTCTDPLGTWGGQ